MFDMKIIIKSIGLFVAVLFGVFLFIYGGYDDSPGAQGLGVLICIGSIYYLVKINKKVV